MKLSGISQAFTGIVERLNPRERVLLGLMVFVAVGMICFLIIFLTNRSISELEEQITQRETSLKQLVDTAPTLKKIQDQNDDLQSTKTADPPRLGTQLQTHATKAGMTETDLEINPQPEEIVGNFVRKSVQVRLRRKPLGELADFWALTVNDKAKFPVAITRLNIRRRRNDEDSFDVDMTVSSYWNNPEPSKANGKSKGRSKRAKNKSSRGKGRS